MENRGWEKIAMKSKKFIIIVISIILILAISVGIGITIYFNNKPKNKTGKRIADFCFIY